MHDYLYSVELSITDLCNMRCVFCPHATTFGNPKNYMSEQTLNVALNHILDFDRPIKIALNGRGEPTLHNNFESMVKILHERIKDTPHYMTMGTNGTKIDKYEHLITYFKRININIYDEHTKPQIKHLVQKYGKRKGINLVLKRTDVTSNFKFNNKTADRFNKFYSNRAGSVTHKITQSKHIPDPKFKSACHKPFGSAYIEYDGSYGLCCDDWDRKLSLSNIYKMSIKEYMIKNNTFKDIATDLLMGNRIQNPCKNCNRNLRWNDEFNETHFESLQKKYL